MHEFGPGLHGGRADVGGNAGQGRVFFRGNNNNHGDVVAVVRQLDHLVFAPFRGGGNA